VVKGANADGCSDVMGVANTEGVGGCNGVEGAGDCTVSTSAGALSFTMSLILVVMPGVILTGCGLST